MSKLLPIRCRPPPAFIEARALIIWLGQRAHIRCSLIKVWQSGVIACSSFRAILRSPTHFDHSIMGGTSIVHIHHYSPAHPLYLWPAISCEGSYYKVVIKKWSSSILLAQPVRIECDGLWCFSVKFSWHSQHVLYPVYIIHQQGHWLTPITLVSGMRNLATIQSEWKETLQRVNSELPGTCPHDWHDVSLLTACTLKREGSLQPLLADAGPRGACVATAGSVSICCGHFQFKAVSSEAFCYISVVCEMSPVVTIELGAKSIEGDSTEHGRVQWETSWTLFFTTVDWRLPPPATNLSFEKQF